MSTNKMSEVSEKHLTHLKGLRDHLQPDELVILNVPALWDGGQNTGSTPCDVIVTNQRVLGFYSRSFPRERLFLDSIDLSALKAVSFRNRSNEPLFRELFLNAGDRKVYVRAPRKRIEDLYASLRTSIEEFAPQAQTALTNENVATTEQTPDAPIFGRQEIKTPLENSSLGITMLFVGGFVLELLGIVFAYFSGSLSNGVPLFLAGLVAYLTSLFLRRRRTGS